MSNEDLEKAIDDIEICLEEAPVDFMGTSSNWRASEKEEKEWRNKWTKALKEVREWQSKNQPLPIEGEDWQHALRRMRDSDLFDDKYNTKTLEFVYAFQMGYKANKPTPIDEDELGKLAKSHAEDINEGENTPVKLYRSDLDDRSRRDFTAGYKAALKKQVT